MDNSYQHTCVENCRRYQAAIALVGSVGTVLMCTDEKLRNTIPIVALATIVAYTFCLAVFRLSTSCILCEVACYVGCVAHMVAGFVASHYLMDVEEFGCSSGTLVAVMLSFPLYVFSFRMTGFKTRY